MGTKINIECRYCGTKYVLTITKLSEMTDLRCKICKDSHLDKEEAKNSDVFGYNSDEPKEDAYIRRKK